MRTKYSLLALLRDNPDLFSEWCWPEDLTSEEIENILDNLVAETIDRDIIWTDAEYMQHYIGIWSKRKCWEWTKLLDALSVEFNPIENYDRQEDTTDATDITDTKNWADDHTITNNLADDHTVTNNLAHDYTETRNLANGNTRTTETSAYDSANYQAKEKITDSGSDTGTDRNAGTDTGTVRTAGSNTGTQRTAGTDTGTLRKAGTVTRTSRIHGNIGVTTSVALLREYLQLYGDICFEDIVINDFITQFVRLVY